MGRARVIVNGLPFTIEGEGTPEQLAGALEKRLQQNPELWDKRRKQLGLSEDDMIALAEKQAGVDSSESRAFQPQLNPGQKFLVGSGRSLTEMARGFKQLFTGDEEDAEISRREADEKALFEKLDEQGIGAEDLGQIAPDVIAFLGSGGLTSLAVRGAGLGLVRPTTGADGAEQRVYNSLASGLLSVAGPGAAKAAGGVFRLGGKAGSGMINSITKLAEKGSVGKALGGTADEAARLAQNANPAIREVGEIALARASDLVQRMNARGKTDVTAGLLNSALRRSVVQTGGRNVLDMATFNKQLLTTADSQFTKGLGKTFGKQVADLRKTFTELTKLEPNMDPKTAETILTGIVSNPQAQALAKGLNTATTDAARQGLASRLVQTSLAVAGQEASEMVNASQGLNQ